MPCNSDYLEASGRERELSRVRCLLDEIAGVAWTESAWRGYHEAVYNKHISYAEADAMVQTLCAHLSQVDVTQYSLEMQMWWRDHQRADATRMANETAAAEKRRVQQAAKAKLSPTERAALGIDEV